MAVMLTVGVIYTCVCSLSLSLSLLPPNRAAMFPDALESAGRVEGLPLSYPDSLAEVEDAEALEKEPKNRGRYRHSLQLLKPFRITHK